MLPNITAACAGFTYYPSGHVAKASRAECCFRSVVSQIGNGGGLTGRAVLPVGGPAVAQTASGGGFHVAACALPCIRRMGVLFMVPFACVPGMRMGVGQCARAAKRPRPRLAVVVTRR